MTIALLGAGSLGSVLAARLAQGGAEVVLVADGARAERLHRGLRVEGLTQFRETLAVQSTPEGCDWLLLCTKSWQLEPLLPRLEAWGVPVVACQNGLLAVEMLAEALGAENVAGFVTGLGAALRPDGSVHHAGGGYAVLGAAVGAPTAALRRLRNAFAAGGIEATLTSDLQSELWLKAIANNAINPVAALAGVPNGALRKGALRERARAACREGTAVAATLEIALPGDAWERALEIMERAAENRCSMLQDLEAQRPTEIDAITGTIVRRGRRTGVPTPVSEALLRTIREREARS
uniref:2-dehydropantoate 2-reductase n=1 Tax=uncultured marine group II/III euryarchaeote KM3_61_H04 TaxID=1456471 RepID=A0A075HHH7_9EURY|nr:Ketopantoate reductase [uncultured marine group II/III euryarchaeote KM3_61_H04]